MRTTIISERRANAVSSFDFFLPTLFPHPYLSSRSSSSISAFPFYPSSLPSRPTQLSSPTDGTSAATSQKMVCQNTCLEYSASEHAIVNNSIANYCPGPDLTNGAREAQLLKDFVDCTNWTTLATNSSDTCVSGESNGEGNCGFGSSAIQLCAHCRGSNPDPCCYDGEYPRRWMTRLDLLQLVDCI
jgi:hypothetical protein